MAVQRWGSKYPPRLRVRADGYRSDQPCGLQSRVRMEQTEPGRPRTDTDGCRRYLPIAVTFDTRNLLLDEEPTSVYEQRIIDQLRRNQAAVRMDLLAHLGTSNGEAKIDNYRAMGPAPWSIAFEHNTALAQIRSAFAHGDFYPALVGSCALGERIFNELISVLLDDYINHPRTTKRAKQRRPLTDWGSAISLLHGWGVLDDHLRDTYLELERRRHESVHFDADVDVEVSEPALAALQNVQEIIAGIFNTHSGPPRFIAGTLGHSFISLEAEQLPLLRRVFLPRSTLVSPRFEMVPGRTLGEALWTVLDDADYDPTPLTDEEFDAALRAPR